MLSYHDEELEIYVVFWRFKAGEIIALLPRWRAWNISSFLAFKAGEIIALLPRRRAWNIRSFQQPTNASSGSSRRFWGCWPQKSRWRSGQISGIFGTSDRIKAVRSEFLNEERVELFVDRLFGLTWIFLAWKSSLKLVADCSSNRLEFFWLGNLLWELSSQTPFTLASLSTIPTPFTFTLATVQISGSRNIRSFKKPRLSQIVQIQSNLQKSIALEMQTSCSFFKKQNVNSFLLSQRFLE